MVGVKGEGLSFHHVLEVADRSEGRQKLAVVRRPECLMRLELGAVVGKRLPAPWALLLEGAADGAF